MENYLNFLARYDIFTKLTKVQNNLKENIPNILKQNAPKNDTYYLTDKSYSIKNVVITDPPADKVALMLGYAKNESQK